MGGDFITITILGVIGILMFAAQISLCFATKRASIRFIPVYMILFFVLFALYVVVFGGGGMGASILTQLLAMGISAALVGDVLAWLVYASIKK